MTVEPVLKRVEQVALQLAPEGLLLINPRPVTLIDKTDLIFLFVPRPGGVPVAYVTRASYLGEDIWSDFSRAPHEPNLVYKEMSLKCTNNPPPRACQPLR
jgi:hypothetical protein